METSQNALATTSNKPQLVISTEALTPTALSIAVRDAGITTVRQSIESDFPSINKIVKKLGYTETASLIVLQIVKLEKMLNQQKQLEPEAIAEIAKSVVDLCLECGVNINAADIDIIFKRAIRGEYGRFYGSIGSQEIIGWFNRYITEKAEEYVQININKSRDFDTYTTRVSEISADIERGRHRDAFNDYKQTHKQ